MTMELKPVRLASPMDNEGVLVLRDDALIAVLSRLGPEHGSDEGCWYVEAVFAASTIERNTQFRDLPAAQRFFDTFEADRPTISTVRETVHRSKDFRPYRA